jgi:hypothetical protein
MKTCSNCKELKPIFEFSKDKKAKDGLCYRCKACSKALMQDWYAANRNRLIAKARANELADPEKARQKKLEYAARHPERVKESNRKYAAKPEVLERWRNDQRRIAYSKRRRTAAKENLADEYVRRIMAQHLSITGSQIPQALVDAHREVMKIKRYLSEQRQ